MTEEQPEKVGAARPTGKRQLAGVSTATTASIEAKNAATSDDDAKAEGNKVAKFLPEVVSEMKKVIWPTTRQMVNYTLITFGFLIFMTAVVAGVDFLAGLGVEKILNP